MKKELVQKLLFLKDSEAQKILDVEAPGHKVTVAEGGYAVIKNPEGKIVARIRPQ